MKSFKHYAVLLKKWHEVQQHQLGSILWGWNHLCSWRTMCTWIHEYLGKKAVKTSSIWMNPWEITELKNSNERKNSIPIWVEQFNEKKKSHNYGVEGFNEKEKPLPMCWRIEWKEKFPYPLWNWRIEWNEKNSIPAMELKNWMKRKISIPTMELKNSNERKKFHN